MQTTKKKPSLIFILVGAVLAGYLGYLINGAWTEGIAFNEFMDRFNEVCAVPFANYNNSNTVKLIILGGIKEGKHCLSTMNLHDGQGCIYQSCQRLSGPC